MPEHNCSEHCQGTFDPAHAALSAASEWHMTTKDFCDDGWKLVEITWQAFLANDDSRALSYRGRSYP